jgi:hypothetical protein
MAEETVVRAPQIGRKIFGATLDYDSAGYYPGIELLNLIFCCTDNELLPEKEGIEVQRRSHDFARKLVWGEEEFISHPMSNEFALNEFSVVALRHLLECLQLEIPSSNKPPTWERAHFFPYTKSLIHWDARGKSKGGKPTVSIERRYLRGGGAYAFNVLRSDQNNERLTRNRKGFRELYSATDSGALELLAGTLASNSFDDDQPRTDDMVEKSPALRDDCEERYCDGVANILSHTDLSSVVRIRSLIRFTGFWLMHVEHVKAAMYLGQPISYLICDSSSRFPQLRRASQRCLKEKMAQIVEASDKAAEDLGGNLARSQRNKIRSFFWATAATIGLLNAWRGRRHFTVKIEMIECLVMAATPSGQEKTYERFLNEDLFGKFNLVLGRTSAEAAGLLNSIDASIFEDNENFLANQMAASGFLTQYSDATRMVNAEAFR